MTQKFFAVFAAVLLAALMIAACSADTNTAQTEKETAAAETAATSEGGYSEETAPPPEGYRQISQDEARQMMDAESGYIILDVRTPEEFAEGHIPGAICISHDEIPTDEIPELPDKDQLIMVYCRSGRRSKLAAQQLADQGYTNVVEFGGINTWSGETTAPDE